VNTEVVKQAQPQDIEVVVQKVEEAEVDKMWSDVGTKGQQRW